MVIVSAGLLLWRRRGHDSRGGAPASPPESIEVLLVHLGGPFWRNRDQGAWFIPKGEALPGESLLRTARREFGEETGFSSPEEPVRDDASSPYLPLGAARVSHGKRVVIFAFEGDCDPARLRSNTFAMEWPPRSGRMGTFPEVDRAAFFPLAAAQAVIHPSQRVFLDRLARQLRPK